MLVRCKYVRKCSLFLPPFLFPFFLPSFFPLFSFLPSPSPLLPPTFPHFFCLYQATIPNEKKKQLTKECILLLLTFRTQGYFKTEQNKTRDSAWLIAVIKSVDFQIDPSVSMTWFCRDGQGIGQLPSYNTCVSSWHQVLMQQSLHKQTRGIRNTRLHRNQVILLLFLRVIGVHSLVLASISACRPFLKMHNLLDYGVDCSSFLWHYLWPFSLFFGEI